MKIEDTFRGDTDNLRRSIKALIELDEAKALVPHGIGGHAKGLLSAAYVRLSTPPGRLTREEVDYRGFQSAVSAIRSWAAGFSDDMTQRRLRAVAQDLEDNRAEILGFSTPPARPERDEVIEYRDMPSYGRCDWTHLRESVAEATTGRRGSAEPFKDDLYPGHHMVEGINFNSLSRIVTAFVDASLLRPATSGEKVERVARAIHAVRFEEDDTEPFDDEREMARAAIRALGASA